MKLIKNQIKIRCELGSCRTIADYALVLDRAGIHSKIYICEKCAKNLLEAAKEVLTEKAVKTKSKPSKSEKTSENALVAEGDAWTN